MNRGPLRRLAAAALGGVARGAVRATRRAPRMIFTYHDVGVPGGVPTDVLAAQLRRLRDAGFAIVGLEEMVRWVLGEAEIPGRAVALTFDDGLASTARTVAPLLRRWGVTATVFPVLAFLGGPRRYGSVRADALLATHDGDPRTRPYDYMTWDELDAWVEAGGDVGGHTLTHPHLDRVESHHGREEVAGCRRILAGRYGRPPAVFCYPFGSHSATTAAWVRDAGFLAAVTSDAGAVRRASDRWRLARLPAPATAAEAFDDLLFGVFRYRQVLRRVLGGASV